MNGLEKCSEFKNKRKPDECILQTFGFNKFGNSFGTALLAKIKHLA